LRTRIYKNSHKLKIVFARKNVCLRDRILSETGKICDCACRNVSTILPYVIVFCQKLVRFVTMLVETCQQFGLIKSCLSETSKICDNACKKVSSILPYVKIDCINENTATTATTGS
jgi:hypothetical protein